MILIWRDHGNLSRSRKSICCIAELCKLEFVSNCNTQNGKPRQKSCWASTSWLYQNVGSSVPFRFRDSDLFLLLLPRQTVSLADPLIPDGADLFPRVWKERGRSYQIKRRVEGIQVPVSETMPCPLCERGEIGKEMQTPSPSLKNMQKISNGADLFSDIWKKRGKRCHRK